MRFANSLRSIEIKKFAFIVIFWTILGALQSVYDHFLIMSHMTTGYHEDSFFLKMLITNTIAGFIGGIIGGYTLVYLVNKRFRSQPFYKGVLVVVIAFISAISLISLILAFFQSYFLHGGLGTPEGLETFEGLIYTTEHIKNAIFWAVTVALTQLGLQINDKFGQGLLWSMMTGKYHLPKTEERIFMFLDLKGSTSIAEHLGNKRYLHFLKALFSDITDPILANGGQIYQYVGDEVVISWPTTDGINENRCVRCFFDVQQTLVALQDEYIEKYQVAPAFKAGLHYGNVVAGEVGIIKRDITYSGDTLNTAARIQGMCNQHESSLLLSARLANLMTLQSFKVKNLGSLELRGKLESIEIIAVEQ
ncbi:MAG: adenylate/guanylate cyclase domain-containing protein [Bacteroidota bacterium]